MRRVDTTTVQLNAIFVTAALLTDTLSANFGTPSYFSGVRGTNTVISSAKIPIAHQ